ncbi:MAG TPA: aldo/keto reductase [Actinomycetes bacterium]
MRMATLGRGGVAVTTLGFGGAPIGNLFQAVEDATAASAVEAAWQAGVRFFDTAPHYGLGLSERRLGRALAGRPRGELTLSTKVGRVLEPWTGGGRDTEGFDVPATHRRVWDFSAAGVRRSLAASLERLGMERVDVALLHDPDDHYRAAVEQAYPALHELRAGGAVGAIGAGMNQSRMLAELVRHTDLDAVLLAGRYSLLDQSALDDLLPLCAARGVAVLAGGVFNSGLLATDTPAPGATYDYLPGPPAMIERARRIAEVCRRHGVSLPQAALAFPAGHPAVASVLVGMRSAEEVERNLRLAAAPVPADLWAELVEQDLLRADAPVPGGALLEAVG